MSRRGEVLSETCKRRRRVYARQYYRDRKDDPTFMAKRRAQRKACRDNNIDKFLWRAAKNRALEHGLAFDIDVTDIIIPATCPVFGTPFEVGAMTAASLDRIDSSKGYIKGNVQVLSRKANIMKSDATLIQLQEFAQWVNQLQH